MVQVLDGDIPEPYLTRPAHMKRDWPITHHPVTCRRVRAAASVERGPHHVGIHDHVQAVPLAGSDLGTGWDKPATWPLRGGRGWLRRFLLLFCQRDGRLSEAWDMSLSIRPWPRCHSRELRGCSREAGPV